MYGYADMLGSFPSDALAQRMSRTQQLSPDELDALREFLCMSVFAPLAESTTLEKIYLVKDGRCVFGKVTIPNGKRIKLHLDEDAADIHRDIICELRTFAAKGIRIEGCGTIQEEGSDVVFVPYQEPTYGKIVLFDAFAKRRR